MSMAYVLHAAEALHRRTSRVPISARHRRMSPAPVTVRSSLELEEYRPARGQDRLRLDRPLALARARAPAAIWKKTSDCGAVWEPARSRRAQAPVEPHCGRDPVPLPRQAMALAMVPMDTHLVLQAPQPVGRG